MDSPGPNKLRYKYKKHPRKRIALVNDFRDVAGTLHIKPGKRIQLLTARGTGFFAHVNHGRVDANGISLLALPWDLWLRESDWRFSRTATGNYFIASYCRALDAWTSIYTGRVPNNGNGQRR
jgi:hypothetical protein